MAPPASKTTASAAAEPRTVFTGIRRIQRTQQVRQQLEEAIARGDYKPGDRLPSERELVEMFGVSRITVREAIRSLEALGLVDVQHGRGCFVTSLVSDAAPFGHWLSIHHKALLDLLKIRGALDALAAEGAAERRPPEELARIREADAEFRAAADDPGTTPARLVELDIAFHRAVAAASGSTLLCHLLDDLSTYLGESRKLVLAPSGRAHSSAAEHAAIVAAIAAGDGEAAKAAVSRHIDGVIAVLGELNVWKSTDGA